MQHGYCIAIGFGSIIVGLLLKFIPRGLFNFEIDEKPMSKDKIRKSLSKIIRKPSKALIRKLSRVDNEKNLDKTETGKLKMMKAMKTFKN